MKTMGQQIVTNQTNFEIAVANVGQDKVMIQQTEGGFDVKDMSSAPIVRLWGDSSGVQVEVAEAYKRPSSNDMRMPDLEFIDLNYLNQLDADLRRLGVK